MDYQPMIIQDIKENHYMKPLKELTYLSQVKRLRRVAECALEQYGLTDARLKLIFHGENNTYRVYLPDSNQQENPDSPYAANRLLLRIHGESYQTVEAIHSEMLWLDALRRDTDLAVPEPLLTTDGRLVAQIKTPEVPQPRICTVLRWLNGRMHEHSPRAAYMQALGKMIAQLHNHATQWTPPKNFKRGRWDVDGLFGDSYRLRAVDPQEIWARVPQPHRRIYEQVVTRTKCAMQELGDGAHVFGLTHADLMPENVLYAGGEARPIDFDDCGYGYFISDIAVALSRWRFRDDWIILRDALLAGYTKHRPLPQEQLAYLDLFIAARDVSIALWAISMTSRSPRFLKELPARLEHVTRSSKKLLNIN